MGGVSTVALIERRPDISRSLFTRYWRDIHGVMAARIPGFHRYTQHHVTPIDRHAEPFEGIAIVTYASEGDRAGLIHSEITRHIHRDEQNVFSRALLYNLGEGAARVLRGSDDRSGQAMFLVVAAGVEALALVRSLGTAPRYLALYDLTGGDPAGWNETDVSGRAFTSLVHGIWADRPSAIAAAKSLPAAAYLLDESFVMVDEGKPTALGLRGLDAVRTIAEAGADNQLSADVVRAIYGAVAVP